MSQPRSPSRSWSATWIFTPKSLRWLTRSTSEDGGEDTHELLSAYESSDYPVTAPRWAQSSSLDYVKLSLHSTRAKALYAILFVGLIAGLIALLASRRDQGPALPHYSWDDFGRLNGFYQGISKLVKLEGFVPQNPNAGPGASRRIESANPFVSPLPQGHSSDFELAAYLPRLEGSEDSKVPPKQECFLQNDDTVPAPAIYALDGVPQHGVLPIFGSYSVLGLRDDVCFERYGRYGPYGLGYKVGEGGTGLGLHGDRSLTEIIWEASGKLNWSSFDLGDAQQRCVERNRLRYPQVQQRKVDESGQSAAETEGLDWQQHRPLADSINGTISRTAFVLRGWQGLIYNEAVKLYIRSLVNELSLYSGGEYEVHLLIEVKDEQRPFSTSKAVHDEIVAELVPEEFRSMATLWSQDLMQEIYPGPFEPQFHFHGSMYPAMRSMHFALQWFMLQYPEYEYFWNWEMDIRYIGHWYELLDRVSIWAKKQPRSYLWARNARYYIPALYDDWEVFTEDTKERSPIDIITNDDFKPNPTPGHEADSEEEADFITFNPIFNPNNTEWNRREDVTGYDTSQPIPERRAAIIAVSRHSRRLLLAMHHENQINRHSMASEMFPPTMALHHGLKAVYVPHPMFLERDWPAENASAIFNGGPMGGTGNFLDSVFGESPHKHQLALQQSTYFYAAKFGEFLWWRWLGYQDYRYDNEGGARDELRRSWGGVRKGRMCLRSTLIHPVKVDEGRSI